MKITTKCDHCGNEFQKDKRRFNEAKKFGWKIYCSRECYVNDRITQIKTSCTKCGKEISVEKSVYNKSKSGLFFCSSSCFATYNNSIRIRSDESKKKTSDSLVEFYSKKGSSRKIVKCLFCGKEIIVNNNKERLFCSKDCFFIQQKGCLPYTKEEVFGEIHRLTLEDKRAPSSKLVKSGLVHAARKFFGTWNNLIKECGIEPNSGIASKKQLLCNDNHYADSISEMLVDNWLHRVQIKHERWKKYPESRSNCDFYLSDFDLWVEYCGLIDFQEYKQSMEKKRGIAEKYNLKLMELYPRDLYPENKLAEAFDRFDIVT